MIIIDELPTTVLMIAINWSPTTAIANLLSFYSDFPLALPTPSSMIVTPNSYQILNEEIFYYNLKLYIKKLFNI